MKYLLIIIVFLQLVGCTTKKSLLHSNQNDDGWIQLFNGCNLDGWRENKFKHKPEWKIVDGVLIGLSLIHI